ncbi:DNA-binding transcriptional regulator, GntR family [Brevibacterium aurantiacum]|uniref:DNA-binding transcriptional regulator, GntR family n=1 Tax=Brevibacterium aurantiacum TaxID=273384 RepID=A0A2H1KX93_BREAU|nr:GntR family transcriptional regulator [Brevibacterium aurantiacum]SMY04350.1 DNA-binding transcriptional regulator, GntR family [Brevibacterium aurantiacum]
MERLTLLSSGTLERSESLRDKALRIVRQAIVAGEITSGEVCSATGLARELGVSVSPVREAMLTLVNEGIMEPVRNKGFRVVELSAEDLDEIFELRLLLEVPSVRTLATLDLNRDSDRLRELAIATEVSAQEGDVTNFLSADRDFHLALIELHGNRRLHDWVAALRDQTRLYGLHQPNPETLRKAADEHRKILDAVLEGNGEAAEHLLTAHLGHTRSDWANSQQ